jgi:glycosyltransferase involved in cell wall biosynthesis
MLRRAAGILAPSRYVRDYILRWGALQAEVLQPPTYGSGPFPDYGNFDHGFVTLINASQIKGVCILEELARARPGVEFAAVPTWATTTGDLTRLSALRNLRLLPPSENIDTILAETRVLLVPSLWGEAFGRIAVEGMLRGIPVLASDIGGLPEAKLGIDYLLPVRPIRSYSMRPDERGLPIPDVPQQAVAPWLEALDRVLSDREHYGQLSHASRAAAMNFVSSLTIAPCEDFLHRLAADQPIVPAPSREAYKPSTAISRERLELLRVLVNERENS